MCLGILEWRKVTPGWANDPVWRHNDRKGREGRVVIGYPSRADIRRKAEKGWSGLKNNSYEIIRYGA